jgi:hypothetical protein
MLFKDGASPAEYWAGLQLAIAKGWLKLHESGTFVTFTPASWRGSVRRKKGPGGPSLNFESPTEQTK